MSPPPPRFDEEQLRTPLFDAMVNLAESRKVSFHTPGHKSGKGIATRFRKFVGPRVFSIDLTTLDEVDSLQNPTGVIKEAQELAAKAAGADRSFFLVNGTTVGNHAMVAATTGPGDKVLIARNCHRSVLTGLIMSGATPIFFQPAFDRDLKLTLNVTFDAAKAAIDANPGARALLITSPNYYGLCTDIERSSPTPMRRALWCSWTRRTALISSSIPSCPSAPSRPERTCAFSPPTRSWAA